MVRWFGKDARYAMDDMPALSLIKGKPEPRGMEVKMMFCSETGIAISLIPSGSKYDVICDDYSGYMKHTAITLRLAKNLKGTGRTIIADSAFGSVVTVAALKNGIGFICNCKHKKKCS